jgi:hypothetical protein
VLIQSAGASTSAEHAVDFDYRIVTHTRVTRTPLGKRAQCGANASRIDECCRRRCRLEDGATSNACGTFLVERMMVGKPRDKRFEIAEEVASWTLRGRVGIYELQPETATRLDRARFEFGRRNPGGRSG